MPRAPRIAPGGVIFHVLNRGNDRRNLFDDEPDFAAFERVMQASLEAVPMRLLGYCLMGNHWHLLLWPRLDGQLAAFMHRLTTMHVRRWHRHRESDGRGHLYQGAYRSFPVQDDRHFLTVARYVERNPLRAGLVKHAENWRWSSLWLRSNGSAEQQAMLSEWPVPMPRGWSRLVDQPLHDKEETDLADSMRRGRPFGDADWQMRTAKRLNLQATFRRRGRPKKSEMNAK
ncbi:MAG TPA: transposase [Tepidisphaeraceae bacterium]|nr:transposase [Tepidisphaeraceae bacterium]